MTDVLVLCYHALSRTWPATLSTTPERFSEQVRLLVDRGYRATTFERAVVAPEASRTLAITFDDAYRSVFELAFPVLRELGVPATVFVPTAFAGSDAPMSWPGIDQWLGGDHESELRCMSWEQLGELTEAGWEIGSHTHTHPRLPELPDDALAAELARSREICAERLGRPCRSLAYPYGAHDERVLAAASAAGYSAAGTLPAAFHAPERLRWPRVGVYHADDRLRFRLKCSPALRRLRASRIWEPLTSIRGA